LSQKRRSRIQLCLSPPMSSPLRDTTKPMLTINTNTSQNNSIMTSNSMQTITIKTNLMFSQYSNTMTSTIMETIATHLTNTSSMATTINQIIQLTIHTSSLRPLNHRSNNISPSSLLINQWYNLIKQVCRGKRLSTLH